jgi:hypothetical protein
LRNHDEVLRLRRQPAAERHERTTV